VDRHHTTHYTFFFHLNQPAVTCDRASHAIAASDVEPDGTGERETDVTVEARLRVENADGDVLARETTSDTATLTVSRDGVEASEYGQVGGDGSLTIATE